MQQRSNENLIACKHVWFFMKREMWDVILSHPEDELVQDYH